MARRPKHTGDDDLIDQLYLRGRQIDPSAWEERDRLEAERGVNPDRMDQTPRTAAERQMQGRRMYSLRLALDEHTCAGDPDIAAALHTLAAAAIRH